MAATSLVLTCASPLFSPQLVSALKTLSTKSLISCSRISLFRLNSPADFSAKFLRRCSGKKDEVLLEGMPPEYYDNIRLLIRLFLCVFLNFSKSVGLLIYQEWQARQREKMKELRWMQREEEEEEERKIEEYREIGMRLKDFPEEDLRKARKLVSSFIRAAEEVEERIEEAAEKGELDELVLMIIWNRLDLARRDDEKDAVRSLDLLYRRVETEILKRQASLAMKLLNDLLNMHDGFEDDAWLKDCRKRMAETFPREDPFSILVPPEFDIDMHQGPLRPPMETETDNTLLRVDFVREVDALLQEVRIEEDADAGNKGEGLDPEAITLKFKQQEKQRTIR